MKWTTAVGHVRGLAGQCAESSELPDWVRPVQVSALWAVGEVLDQPHELDWVTVALGVDLPAVDVPWFCPPAGAGEWANATRLSKNPVVAWWRSTHAPVWNHRIVRPVLIWDAGHGVRGEALDALLAGRGAEVGEPAPGPDEFASRMAEELSVSEAALARRTADYEAGRWGRTSLAKIADPLFDACLGYLDVLEAQPRGEPGQAVASV